MIPMLKVTQDIVAVSQNVYVNKHHIVTIEATDKGETLISMANGAELVLPCIIEDFIEGFSHALAEPI